MLQNTPLTRGWRQHCYFLYQAHHSDITALSILLTMPSTRLGFSFQDLRPRSFGYITCTRRLSYRSPTSACSLLTPCLTSFRMFILFSSLYSGKACLEVWCTSILSLRSRIKCLRRTENFPLLLRRLAIQRAFALRVWLAWYLRCGFATTKCLAAETIVDSYEIRAKDLNAFSPKSPGVSRLATNVFQMVNLSATTAAIITKRHLKQDDKGVHSILIMAQRILRTHTRIYVPD